MAWLRYAPASWRVGALQRLARLGALSGTLALSGLGFVGAALVGCDGAGVPDVRGKVALGSPVTTEPEASVRGVILISLDTLRADHVGANRAEGSMTPNMDRFAERAVVFDRAMTQYPSTVLAHMSMLTGLYPAEHAVYPPLGVLPIEIPSLAEGLADAGVRTASHNEAGYMSAQFGFSRGFSEYSETYYGAERGIDKTLSRGLNFLESLDQEPFFLFLHTYSIHDPYEPPADARALYVRDPLPEGVQPTGEWMREHNLGKQPLQEGVADALHQLYEAQVWSADAALGRFLQSVEDLGLFDETMIIVTSDHGEEFAEHGRLAHTQIYPENLFVPLIVYHPEGLQRGRVERPVGIVDVAPTVFEALGVVGPPMSGESLVPEVLGAGDPSTADQGEYAEVLFDGVATRSWVQRVDGTLWQLLVESPPWEPDGAWVSTEWEMDAWAPSLEVKGLSYGMPRRLEVERAGRLIATVELTPTWSEQSIPLEEDCAPCRILLRSADCSVPAQLGDGTDTRCLGFKLDAPLLGLGELYQLDRDPLAKRDLFYYEPLVAKQLWKSLAQVHHVPAAPPARADLSPDVEAELRALGYL